MSSEQDAGAVLREKPKSLENVEDILGDLDVLLHVEALPEGWTIEARTHVGTADERWAGVGFRRVYEAKPVG